jgi:peroxiredoxin Q/BCP
MGDRDSVLQAGHPARYFLFILSLSATRVFHMPDFTSDKMTGTPAPAFCLPDAEGEEYCLTDFAGKWLVLYFYPKDNTPGCTIEAKGFSDALEEFAALGAEIVGISADSPDSHQKFTAKQGLRFRLLSDQEHSTLIAYNVWKDRLLLKGVLAIERTTFLIDPTGTIAAVWRKVNVHNHVEEVRNRLREVSR